MALFRKADRSAGRIEGFWRWWAAEGRGLAEASIAGAPEGPGLADAITAWLKPLGALGWELAPGDTSAHLLVLTAEGDPARRAVARRLVLAAPPADDLWSYVDTRPAAPDPESRVVELDGVAFDLARVSVAARLTGIRFEVQVHHPAYADVAEQTRARVSLLALEAALGEVDTQLWIGELQPTEVSPLDGFGLSALRSVVRDLARQHTDADGRPTWALLQGEGPGGPLVASARTPLHPLTSPSFDTYVAVVLPYVHRTADGLPDAASLEHLREFEDRLGAQLGTGGAVVAHQSVAGVRTLHVYVDSTTDLVSGVRQLATTWSEAPGSVHDAHDPAWDSVRHLRT